MLEYRTNYRLFKPRVLATFDFQTHHWLNNLVIGNTICTNVNNLVCISRASKANIRFAHKDYDFCLMKCLKNCALSALPEGQVTADSIGLDYRINLRKTRQCYSPTTTLDPCLRDFYALQLPNKWQLVVDGNSA